MIPPADALNHQAQTTTSATTATTISTTAASQESVVSDSSHLSALAAPDLLSSSSNLSNSTAPDSGLTSPASSIGLPLPTEAASVPRSAAMTAAMQLDHVQADPVGRVRTPEPLQQPAASNLDGHAPDAGVSAHSPMVVDAPYVQQLHQASKRTASGTVKPSSGEVTVVPASPEKAAFESARSPAPTDGPNRKRISELSAQLKTRLSYAMVKVQHGWENRSLGELEQSLPTPTSSAPARIPMTPTSTHRMSRHAPRPSLSSINTAKSYESPYTDYARRYAHSPDAFGVQSPASQPAMLRRTISSSSGEGRPASHSPQTYASFWAQHERNPLPPPHSARRHAHHSSTSTVTSVAPSLAPPAEMVSSSAVGGTTSVSSKRRSQHGRAPPSLGTAGAGGRGGQVTPSKARLVTPKTPRQNFLRMPSQQAEKDAVDTLMFMSSPNNSANMKHASQQGSPLRAEFPVDIRG